MKPTLAIDQAIFSLLLALLAAPVSAQDLDQQCQQQQSERDRVLAICIKQYAAAEYRPTDRNSELRYMMTSQGVQEILPSVMDSPSGGQFKCEEGDEVIRQIGEEYRYPSESMPLRFGRHDKVYT